MMLDSMMLAIFLFLGAVAVGFIALAANALIAGDADGMCAPSRRANITASQPQARRHIVVELGPPAGWHEPAIVPAPARAVVVEDNTPMPPRRRVVYAQLQPETAVQDLAPIAVPSWPTRQTVEQPEPAQVAVNRTAARFSALELRGGK